MNHPSVSDGDDSKQEHTTKEQEEIREKLYDDILEQKTLMGAELFEKLKEVHSNLDQVHTCLAKSQCPTDVYNLLSPVIAQVKTDLTLIWKSVAFINDGLEVGDEMISEQGHKIRTLEGVIETKEKERTEWANMCIKKQTTIESLNIDFFRIHENLVLGNPIEANKIALQAIGEIPK